MYGTMNYIIDIIAAIFYLMCIYECIAEKEYWHRIFFIGISLYIFYRAGDFKLLLVPIAYVIRGHYVSQNESDSSSTKNENIDSNSKAYSNQNYSQNVNNNSKVDLKKPITKSKESINNKKIKPSKTSNISYSKNVIDLNTASKSELIKLKVLDLYTINKIISLREVGEYFTSYEHLQKELHINNKKLEELKKVTVIKDVEPEKTIKQDNKPKPKIRINLNTASEEELKKIRGLSNKDVNKLLILRKNGVKFNSFKDLREKAELKYLTVKELEKNTIIIPNKKSENNPENNSKKVTLDELDNIISDTKTEDKNNKEIKQTKQDKENKKVKQEPDMESKKIDINNADQQTLSKIPSINIIKAKKIIDLREQGKYIESYEDLQNKLNLKPEQINQIKETTIITKPKVQPNMGRIMDI